jgi:hypothetical protein
MDAAQVQALIDAAIGQERSMLQQLQQQQQQQLLQLCQRLSPAPQHSPILAYLIFPLPKA